MRRTAGRGALLLVTTSCLMAGSVLAQESAEDGGPRVEVGDLTVDLGGYGSFRYEANDADELASSITFRRFVVTTDARYGERFQVYSEIEYERLSEIEVERGATVEEGGIEFEQELEGTNGSEIAVEQAWGQFNFVPEVGLRFGAVLPPVGRFNLNHDDDVWNFPRRPLADRAAQVLPAQAAWTELGIGIVGEVLAGEVPIRWQAYAMNGVSLDFAIEEKVQTRNPSRDKLLLEAVVSPTAGAFDGSNETNAFAGRLAVSPTLGSEIALSGYVGEYTPAYLDAEASLATIGVDGRALVGPVYLEGEFLHTMYDDLDAVLTDFARVARDHAVETSSSETAELESEIEIVVDGVSDERRGLWLDLGWPIPLERGTWGFDAPTVTPVLRFERVWYEGNLAAFDFENGQVTELEKEEREQQRVTFGVALRPIPQAVFHLAWERNDALDGALIDPGISADETNALVFGMAVGF